MTVTEIILGVPISNLLEDGTIQATQNLLPRIGKESMVNSKFPKADHLKLLKSIFSDSRKYTLRHQ